IGVRLITTRSAFKLALRLAVILRSMPTTGALLAGVGPGRDYTFCEQFASVVTPKNISIRKSSLQQAHLIFRRL
ncbi:hypothetical protein, partial [Aeromonas caviae]|uniref:hypothetical protein n=1 Tax=Aeromonas caviae TaxID=648 RepID=UPI0040392FCB